MSPVSTPPEDAGAKPIFANEAQRYWEKGLCVVPLKPASKEPALPGWNGFINGPPGQAKQQEWLSRYPNHGIGLLTGSPLPSGERLGAIDVDQDVFVRITEAVLA